MRVVTDAIECVVFKEFRSNNLTQALEAQLPLTITGGLHHV